MTQAMSLMIATIAQELNVSPHQVGAAIRLLDEGATVPFIARYRKEATQGLDDTQLRRLADRLSYCRELDERRTQILQTIRDLGQLSAELEQAILAAETKTRLEDLYLPYRPKRRTKASIAKEAGLEPLALRLLQDEASHPEKDAEAYLNTDAGIETVADALEGARQILMERFAEEPDLLDDARQYVWEHATLTSKASQSKPKKGQEQKYTDYLNYVEPIKKIPSHRALALFRGRRESVLQLSLALQDELYGEQRIARYFKLSFDDAPRGQWLKETVRLAWKLKVWPKLELEAFSRLRELADEEAINVFARNLRDLLLAAPAGPKITIGLDPGIRTGVKVVVVDHTGKLIDYTTIFPLAPQNEWHASIAELAKMAARYNVNLISIGNGTGSRETDRLVSELIKMYPDLKLSKVVVNEAGASVYSASELAANEFPDLDVTLRGAVSIARRLQDPLAELVKIEPKSIGVGQYQHDVNQSRLGHCLAGVVEDCVNAVGVDVNMASVPLLTYVSGFNETLASNLVKYRDEHGVFKNREQLKNVPRMGEKAFQQAAGFLRIMNGDHPLDASGVHPEAYPIVERMLADQNIAIQDALRSTDYIQRINLEQYVDDQHGLPTLRDILQELEKPGRDPRPVFKTVSFKDGVEEIHHLEEGMVLDGVVSNVTNFGAFVDIGVHQDGLVHISAMTDRFIKDPRAMVKAGDVVRVKVLAVDKERRRISLTMKLQESKPLSTPSSERIKDAPIKKTKEKREPSKATKPTKPVTPFKSTVFNTTMADALSKLKQGQK